MATFNIWCDRFNWFCLSSNKFVRHSILLSQRIESNRIDRNSKDRMSEKDRKYQKKCHKQCEKITLEWHQWLHNAISNELLESISSATPISKSYTSITKFFSFISLLIAFLLNEFQINCSYFILFKVEIKRSSNIRTHTQTLWEHKEEV